MNNIELKEALLEKMQKEQEKYRGWLLKQEPREILNHSYRYSMQEDIIHALEENRALSDNQLKALLKSPCPLSDVYKGYEKYESDHMEELSYCIELRANTVIKNDRQKEGR